MTEVTRILSAIEEGDPCAAEQLLPLVYEALAQLAAEKLAHEQPGQTLQATALVHEAYLRLLGGKQIQSWDGRGHFFAAAAEAMRRILIDRARNKQTRKAGGGRLRLDLDDIEPAVEEENGTRLLVLDKALRQLEADDPRKAELVKLRFFAGLTTQQAAAALGVSTSTAEKDWAYARSWLRVAIDRMSDRRADRPEKNRYGFGTGSSHYILDGPAARRGGPMNASRPDNETIFHAARDIPDPDRRREYVREACGGTKPGSLTSRRCWRPPMAPTACWTVRRQALLWGPSNCLSQRHRPR